jgi:hypothetical protein
MFTIVGLPASPVIAPMTVTRLWLCSSRRLPGNFAFPCYRLLSGPMQDHLFPPLPLLPPTTSLPIGMYGMTFMGNWVCLCRRARSSFCCMCDVGPPLWTAALGGGAYGQLPSSVRRGRGAGWRDCRTRQHVAPDAIRPTPKEGLCMGQQVVAGPPSGGGLISSGRSRGVVWTVQGARARARGFWYLPGR